MAVISAAVGRGKANNKDDVKIVQRLLNGQLGKLVPYAPLEENGVYSDGMGAMILEYQRRQLRMEKPDGVVGPNGPTILALTAGGNVHLKANGNEHKVPEHVNAFITMALPYARKVKATWKVPIGGLIAQSALETGWGRHVKGNAYFGIKGKSEAGESTSFTTREVIDGKSVTIVDKFRAYKDFEEAADDYGRFLNNNDRYKEALKYPDHPINFVKEVAKAGYATDPNYAKSLVSIIKSYGLEQYDRE